MLSPFLECTASVLIVIPVLSSAYFLPLSRQGHHEHVCMQLSKLVKSLDSMEARVKNGAHQVEGELGIAGRLLRQHVLGVANGAEVEGAAEVFCADSASIQRGASIIRTETGSGAHGRTRCDHFAYVPFLSGRTQNPCVMHVEQILLVRQAGMGWQNDEARIAVGILYDRLPVHRGAGLRTCSRAIHYQLTRSQKIILFMPCEIKIACVFCFWRDGE